MKKGVLSEDILAEYEPSLVGQNPNDPCRLGWVYDSPHWRQLENTSADSEHVQLAEDSEEGFVEYEEYIFEIHLDQQDALI